MIFLYNYLELACHDKQNGGQIIALHPRIIKLWQFKGHKNENNHEKDRIAFVLAGLWRSDFLVWRRMLSFSTGSNVE